MPQIKGHKKPITKAANVGSTKIGHHFLIVFPTMIGPLSFHQQGEAEKFASPVIT